MGSNAIDIRVCSLYGNLRDTFSACGLQCLYNRMSHTVSWHVATTNAIEMANNAIGERCFRTYGCCLDIWQQCGLSLQDVWNLTLETRWFFATIINKNKGNLI